jgi:hypothetical protein
MNILTNLSLIKRNTRIAQASMIGGLLILAGGMALSFTNYYQKFFYLSVLSLVLGFILSQVGIYFTNHYARRPRPDEQLNAALKGLDGRYTLYHYLTPVPHLLIGPAGIWVLLPRVQKGKITFERGRWKQKGGNMYLKLFAQENLGRPDVDAAAEIDKVTQFFSKQELPEGVTPQVNAALVFTHPQVSIEIAEDADMPALAVTADKLKEALRKSAKSKPINATTLQQVTALFPAESK